LFFLKFLFLVIAVVVAVAAALVLRPSWFFGVNGHQMAYSVNREIRAAAMDCDQVADGSVKWQCFAEADPGSGSVAHYSVRLKDSDCWTARRTEGSQYKRRASGCVKSSDPWWDPWGWID
jgi:hypothetical protein